MRLDVGFQDRIHTTLIAGTGRKELGVKQKALIFTENRTTQDFPFFSAGQRPLQR